jgi:deoxyribodipyrimidine photo-lyase
MTTLFWFRRDLRLSDNPALLAAVQAGSGRVVPVFVLDPDLLAGVGPTRAAYLQATLGALDASLEGHLVVREGSPAHVLAELCAETGARAVFATADFAPSGRARDTSTAQHLSTLGIAMHYLDSPYVVQPGTVVTKAGTPSKVFTPFRRYWELEPVPAPVAAPDNAEWVGRDSIALTRLGELAARQRPAYFGDLEDGAPSDLGPVGERAAHALLEQFLPAVANYDECRNLPGVAGTSRLSPHLRFGTIHPRQVLAATNGDSRGSEVFRSEIAWREFYADVLWHHPDSTWRVLQPALEHLKVDTDDAAVERFQTWARGETGYPIVDAGMRQLRATGWMHNRVRMITASFLVKHLHLDWRWGAKWFMWSLIDGDVASNQHGWQWTAGTGTDASPFHRIFNPTLQAERFDPTGAYVHTWVPELRGVAAPACLQPGGGTGLLAPAGYVSPMIDAQRERDEALARFAHARAERTS